MISRIEKKVKGFMAEREISKIENQRPLLSDFSKTLCIFSNPRGGSTWLAEMLNKSGQFITVNEPFFQGKFRTDGSMPAKIKGRKYLDGSDFWFYHPITEENANSKHKMIVERVLSGKYLNPILTPYSDLNELRSFDQIMVKFCYGNLMMPWIVENYNVAAVLLIRHPCAVVSSQLKVKGAFDHILNKPEFNLPEFPGSHYFNTYKDILKHIKRPEENLAAIWAITVNHLAKKSKEEKRWLTLKYESIISDPHGAIDKIKNRYPNFTWNRNNADVYAPSKTTLDSSLKNHLREGTQSEKWKNELSGSQIRNIMNIVKQFEIDIYDE